jgi:hypothetical protein
MALADQGLPVPTEDELLTEANMQSEGMDFTELQRLARTLGLRTKIEFPKDAHAIPGHISRGTTVIAQIDRYPLDGEATRHVVPRAIKAQRATGVMTTACLYMEI